MGGSMLTRGMHFIHFAKKGDGIPPHTAKWITVIDNKTNAHHYCSNHKPIKIIFTFNFFLI